MHDLIIENGAVIDGSGAPRRRADLAIRDGRIAALGALGGEASRRRIDADGRIVSPGFVDIHTHYDAQAFWDGTLSPSSFHGVTTVVGGNCGFSIAPLPEDEDGREYLMRMLARVEGMPLESLRAGPPWSWRSFGDYLDLLEGKLAVNAGFMVGHSALRCVVMGERALGSSASAAELDAMRELLRLSIQQGGLGFSSSVSPTHNDMEGRPVPSRHAAPEELLALAAELKDLPGTVLEFLPGIGEFSDAQMEQMATLSRAAQRSLNWNVMQPSSLSPDTHRQQLKASDYAAERGGKVVALTVPQAMHLRLNFVSGFVLDALPGWAPVLGLPLDERKKALADPETRARLNERARSKEAGILAAMAAWENYTIQETFAAANKAHEGLTVGELASRRGVEPFDAMLDLALSDELKTSFGPPSYGDDDASWAMRGEIWQDRRTVIGASDAGAHLDMMDTFAFTTQLLGVGVRERALIGLEEAVRQLSDVPARLYGMRGRGRLEADWHADVVVFDERAVACGPTYTRYDLPAGAARLYADAKGIDHVIVSGREIVADGQFTGELPGAVLRSGRDTETVAIDGA